MKMIKLLLPKFLLLIPFFSFAQNNIGIGTVQPNVNALLDLTDSSHTKGLLIPRLSDAQITALGAQLDVADDGLLVYENLGGQFKFWDAAQLIWKPMPGENTDEQFLTISGDTLSIHNGNSVVLSGFGNDADADPTNEIQDLTFDGSGLTISSGNTVDLSGLRDEDWAKFGGGFVGLTDHIYHIGNVGIGTVLPLDKLHVAGSVRIGEITNDDGSLPGYGDKLFFSGADDWLNSDSENSDFLWMARYNSGLDQSELRVNIGDNTDQSGDKFVVGTHTTDWQSRLTVQMDGNVGVGTDSPNAKLDVHGNFHLAGAKPVILRRYNNIGDNPNYNTGYSYSAYAASIAGFRIIDGDIDENGAGDMIQIYMYNNNGTWHIRADMWSHNNSETWYVDVMYIDRRMVDLIGY